MFKILLALVTLGFLCLRGMRSDASLLRFVII